MLEYIDIRLGAKKKKQMGGLLSLDIQLRLIIALTIEGLSIVSFWLFAWTQIQ